MGCSASVSPAVSPIKLTTMNRASSPIDFEPLRPPQRTVETFTEHEVQHLATQTETVETEKVFVQLATTTAETSDGLEPHAPLSPNPRLTANPKAYNTKWVLSGFEAQQFSLANTTEIMSVGPTALQDAVNAIKRTEALAQLPPAVWTFLDLAVQKNDPSYLIRAYTVESDFYRMLNRALADYEKEGRADMNEDERLMAMLGDLQQSCNQALRIAQAAQAGQAFTPLASTETNWARLFLKPLLGFLSIPNAKVRYQGKAYRGLWLSRADALWYTDNTDFICNKAVTSTSKSRIVAQGFIDSISPASDDHLPTIFIYNVEADCALYALDISGYSQLPEEEVLLLPGVLWKVKDFRQSAMNTLEIELGSAFKDMMAMFSPDGGPTACPVQ